MALSEKSRAILQAIAKGHTYEQILVQDLAWTYHDAFQDRFAKMNLDTGMIQAGGFHHRLRDGENYAQKWQYVRENPVRAELVARPEDWPYFGRVHEIGWAGD